MSEDATPRKISAGGEVARPDPRRGALIGRYIVLDPIGEGGVGRVYLAYDPQLDRTIALKLLAPSAGVDASALIEEGRALARFTHPHVVAIHDVGHDAAGPYIAMDYCDGGSLAQFMREGAWQEGLSKLLLAGRGLAAAHRANLVHRDFKPSNVLLDREGGVYVADFGLARDSASSRAPLPDHGRPRQALQQTVGSCSGTPAYMAPEQHEGREVGPAADQYAFCVAAFEVVYGVLPFTGEEDQLLAAKRARAVLEPVHATRVPGWMHRVILRGLSPDPTERFPDLQALVAALDPVRRRRRRRPWWAGGLVAAGALATVGALWPRPVPPAVRTELEDAAIEARAAAAKAYFVYPPPEEPDYVTAFGHVLAIESRSNELAQELGVQLRTEFASTLSRLGDEYWDEPGGMPFAIDFYAQALVFEPEHEHARSRAHVSVGELVALRDKATRGGFSSAELDAAELLVALADRDEGKRRTRLEGLRKRRRPRALSTQIALDQLVEPGAPTDGAGASGVPPEAERAGAGAGAADGSGRVAGSPPETTGRTGRAKSSASAKALVERGRAAVRGGNVRAALASFHEALLAAPGYGPALAELSDLYFDQGKHAKALEFASKAAKAQPKRSRHHIRIGDANLKLLRYKAARDAYERAQAMGSADATGRLRKLAKRMEQ